MILGHRAWPGAPFLTGIPIPRIRLCFVVRVRKGTKGAVMGIETREKVLHALLELEAEAIAAKTGLTLEETIDALIELWSDGELEVRQPAEGKFILCQRGSKATWLHPV
jgi:hypothetical protein